MDQEKIINILQRFLNELNNKQIHIDQAFLYGSYAKNKSHSESDIDIMLISSLFDSNYYDNVGKIWVIAKKFHERIEPYLVGKQKFRNDDISPIIEIVKREGIEIPIGLKESV
ncbi:MAG: hypothetical protein GVY19_03865 [Bacteroidetes bacterium]|jgi:predicted nucleotidyltransferase|nr:hypothetical protein [Bacteroidota bacterium]